MPYEILIAGSLGAAISIGAFGGAVRETLRISALRETLNRVVCESVPDNISALIKSLGGGNHGDRVE